MLNVSLSQEIIFGTESKVLALIDQGANVNEKDRYGLTPLIESVIKNNIQIARALLDHGARINQEDITGQTALQWAVNRYNLPFCELFLQHKADPNHHSADGQPILVNPILRDQQDLIQRLVSFGGELDFALDYISAKLMGHRFELSGRAYIINTKGLFIDLDLEGFYLEFTVGIIFHTLMNFVDSTVGKRYSAYAMVMQKILRTLKTASQLIQYKYTTQGYKEHLKTIREALNKDLVVIPVGYEGHAITFIKYGNFFAKCDRGVKHIVDTVVVYEVGNPYALTPEFLIDLMYQNKSDEYINTELKTILNLKPFATLPPRYQLSGNCSWANVEASIPAMMFLLMFKGNVENKLEIANLKKSVMNYYDTWVEWDKDRVLNESIADFDKAISKEKKISKATLLGEILLYRCKPSLPREVERAKKILSILTMPEYRFILQGYVNVYFTKVAGKIGQDFIEILRKCGFDFSTLTLKK